MAIPDEAVLTMLDDGYFIVRPDGDVVWMRQVKSADGEEAGVKVFSYRVAVTHSSEAESLSKPFFACSHKFTLTPEDGKCKVTRVVTDFEQHEKLELKLSELLKGGMIAQENATLAEMCSA